MGKRKGTWKLSTVLFGSSGSEASGRLGGSGVVEGLVYKWNMAGKLGLHSALQQWCFVAPRVGFTWGCLCRPVLGHDVQTLNLKA